MDDEPGIRSKKLVVIATDCVDVAVNEVRMHLYQGLAGTNTDVGLEPAVEIVPFSIIHGAFIVRLLAEAAVSGTVIFVVFNPIEDEPERLVGVTQSKKLVFLGRNTGVFGWLIRDFGCSVLRELPKQDYVPFGGKNVYPQVLASILNGIAIDTIGTPLKPACVRDIQINDGTVVHVDNFGIAKIKANWSEIIPPSTTEGTRFHVLVNGLQRVNATFKKRLMGGQDDEWVIYAGSSLGGMPELAKVRANGALDLGLQIGDVVSLAPII